MTTAIELRWHVDTTGLRTLQHRQKSRGWWSPWTDVHVHHAEPPVETTERQRLAQLLLMVDEPNRELMPMSMEDREAIARLLVGPPTEAEVEATAVRIWNGIVPMLAWQGAHESMRRPYRDIARDVLTARQ